MPPEGFRTSRIACSQQDDFRTLAVLREPAARELLDHGSVGHELSVRVLRHGWRNVFVAVERRARTHAIVCVESTAIRLTGHRLHHRRGRLVSHLVGIPREVGGTRGRTGPRTLRRARR